MLDVAMRYKLPSAEAFEGSVQGFHIWKLHSLRYSFLSLYVAIAIASGAIAGIVSGSNGRIRFWKQSNNSTTVRDKLYVSVGKRAAIMNPWVGYLMGMSPTPPPHVLFTYGTRRRVIGNLDHI